ncbi:MarR family winged helix-turn-helix transcriptional regulator [Plantactinospora sp. WMMB334]|uniref:MarR family winged helix-turn-helix transcriptional regulator n=1 Tax=Plantactinospora sp. WMMB334 TaxID=3404119 RepID=UPI003B951B74
MYMDHGGEGREGQRDARDLPASWSQIALFASAVDTRLGKWLADAYSIGLTEYRALLLLSRAPDKELRVNDLAQQVGLNQSSVTRLLSRLEAKSLSYRDICPDDGRGVYAVIADKGMELLREVRTPYEAKVAEVLEDVADQQVTVGRHQVSRAFMTVGELLGK